VAKVRVSNEVVAELRRLGREGYSGQVFELMQAIIVRQLGVDPSEVVPSARFVKDLHVD
jgi:hypothetical protein